MSIAIAKSAVLATAPTPVRTAPTPVRTALGQGNAYDLQERRAIFARATELVDEFSAGRSENGFSDEFAQNSAVVKLAEEFGIAKGPAYLRLREAVLRKATGEKPGFEGGGSVSAPRPAYQFGSTNEAKTFALDKLSELKTGISQYNASILDWTTEKAQALREKIWTDGYEGFKRFNPGASEKEAIAFADAGLKGYLRNEGVFENSFLTGGLGGVLAAFNPSDPLISYNDDGTLRLNETDLRDSAGNLIVRVGGDLGQNVDKAA